jgi:hypothetical protein
MTGKRQVRVWNDYVWVTVRATPKEGKYLVEPDEGEPFHVEANTTEQLNDEIAKELRRQFPNR